MEPQRLVAWIERQDAGYIARVLIDRQSDPVTREFDSPAAAYAWVIVVAEVRGALIDWSPCIPPPEPPLLSC
jgi:hypothetical protein